MKRTIEQVTCDRCDADVLHREFATLSAVGDEELHLCKECLNAVHCEIDREYRRVFHGQVPDRRGGWRQLGEYDG